MIANFFKYQGAGNDFVIIDNRNRDFPKDDVKIINRICDRKFGIGADGLMLLENSDRADFKMIYFNADGHEGSMCGNGGRCLVAFANSLGIFENETIFEAGNTLYKASLHDDQVSLQMSDVKRIEKNDGYVFLDTGSPHHVSFENNISDMDVYATGKSIRYSAPYLDSGTNVNFVEKLNDDSFKIRTYERGVENETLSCGTGATAAALAAHYLEKTNKNKVMMKTLGGNLTIDFEREGKLYHSIVLSGPATFVYKGSISV